MNVSDHCPIEESIEWRIFGKRLPKSEAVFFSQTILIYIVVLICIINLSLGNGNSNLWTALLSSSLGYILPNPSLKTHRRRATVDTTPLSPASVQRLKSCPQGEDDV